jgi:hypothetical protein
MKIEFRDRRRAYFTQPLTQQLYEVEYEVDGDREILRNMPGGGNIVLTKDGAGLKSGTGGLFSMNLKRQPAK